MSVNGTKQILWKVGAAQVILAAINTYKNTFKFLKPCSVVCIISSYLSIITVACNGINR